MARGEVATKREDFERQQLTMLAVLGASLVVGIAFSLMIYLLRVIIFNAEVLAAKDESIVNYSKPSPILVFVRSRRMVRFIALMKLRNVIRTIYQ